MKKLLLFLFIAIAGIQAASSTQYESTYAIEVRRLSNWAPDYLTVTNNWDNMTYQPMTTTLRCMSVVTAINGESTKDMEEEEFYSLFNLSDQFTLDYMTKINGVNKTFTKTFTKRKGKLLVTQCDPSPIDRTVSLLSDNDVDFFQFNTFDYRLAGDDQLKDKTIMSYNKFLNKINGNLNIYAQDSA